MTITAIGVKKERSVVGQTNRSASNSPRRGVPPGGVNSVSLLDSVKSLHTTASSTFSPRTSANGGPSGVTSPRCEPRSAVPATTTDGAISSIAASPRTDSKEHAALTRENSVAAITDTARVNGMRALLFDKFDTDGSAPPIPAAPMPNTRFSSRTSTNTALMVQPQKGTSTHAAPTEQFSSRGACHLDQLLGSEDKKQSAHLASARAEHSRILQSAQRQHIADYDQRTVQQDKDRIHAKSMLQQQYETTRRGKTTA